MIMNVARKLLLPPGMLLWWAIYLAVFKLPTWAAGFFVVPFLYQKRYTPLKDMPKLSLPWINPEDWHGGFKNYDGSVPPWYIKKMGKDNFWTFYRYHAMRNPADGLRNFEDLNLWINKDMVHYWTPKYFDHYEPWHDRTPGVRGYLAWQSIWLGVKVQWVREKSYTEFKFGWRVEPRDAHHELDQNSARRHLGASFATKLVLRREL